MSATLEETARKCVLVCLPLVETDPPRFVLLTERVAAAIREDRAEPVSEAEVMAALAVVSREARIAMGRDFMRAALEAARKTRAGDAR